MGDPLIFIMVIALIIEALTAAWSVWDTRRKYDRKQISSVVYDRLVYGDTRVAIGGGILVFLALYGLLGYAWDWPSLRPWGSMLLGLSLGLLLWGPISTRRMLNKIANGKSTKS